MRMINVTDLRRNAKDILSEVIVSKQPVVILQRSKPVAYLVDAESFESLQHEGKNFNEKRKNILDRVFQLQEKVADRVGIQEDSTPLIRELREGIRHE